MNILQSRRQKTPADPTDNPPIGPPPLLLIWLLVVFGLGVLAAGVTLRLARVDTSKTTVTQAGKPTKVTTVSSSFSDSLLIALVGTGALLVLCGAFYTRISKITLPGGGAVELAAYQAQAALAVGRSIEKEQPAADEAGRYAMAAPVATALTAARGAQLAFLAAKQPEAAKSLLAVNDLDVDVEAVRKENRLPTEFWDKLAEASLRDVLRAADAGEPE